VIPAFRRTARAARNGFHLPTFRRSDPVSRVIASWFRCIVGLSAESQGFQAELARLEDAAEKADWPARAQLFNRAGDLCAKLPTERELALGYYGRCVDAYLEAGAFESAAAMCRKLLRFAPQVVRAHCTLAFLSVRDARIGGPALAIAAYVAATKKTRTERFAIPRLRMMAEATDNAEVRRIVGTSLLELRDVQGGNRILNALEQGEPALLPAGEQERWNRLLRAVVMDPQELWERAWINLNTFRTELPGLADLHEVLDGDRAGREPREAAAV
jgi:tetratricopeptide (TPR) repeat protein